MGIGNCKIPEGQNKKGRKKNRLFQCLLQYKSIQIEPIDLVRYVLLVGIFWELCHPSILSNLLFPEPTHTVNRRFTLSVFCLHDIIYLTPSKERKIALSLITTGKHHI